MPIAGRTGTCAFVGSDYPHQIGSIPLMLETIRSMMVSDDVKEQIFGGNARRLLGL